LPTSVALIFVTLTVIIIIINRQNQICTFFRGKIKKIFHFVLPTDILAQWLFLKNF
jgi:hypothetical protein